MWKTKYRRKGKVGERLLVMSSRGNRIKRHSHQWFTSSGWLTREQPIWWRTADPGILLISPLIGHTNWKWRTPCGNSETNENQYFMGVRLSRLRQWAQLRCHCNWEGRKGERERRFEVAEIVSVAKTPKRISCQFKQKVHKIMEAIKWMKGRWLLFSEAASTNKTVSIYI